MKRWTIRILICLVLISGGAIVNVAVAWSGAVWWPAHSNDRNASRFMVREWPGTTVIADNALTTTFTLIPNAGGGHPTVVDQTELPHWVVHSTSAHDAASRRKRVRGVAVGWPLRSISGSTCYEISPPFAAIESSGILHLKTRDVDVPFALIFPGFIINTLFYAIVWLALFASVTTIRRTIRRRRGRCVQCGYDLRSNLAKGCPECGWGRE